jgi:hypothetical protein
MLHATTLDTRITDAEGWPATDAGAAFPSALVPCGSRSGAWHCAWTHPQDERRAHIELCYQGFESFLPYVLSRRRIEVAFPRYLFVRFDHRAPWRTILSTRGVAGLICHGPNCPTTLPAAVIDALIARTSGRGVIDDEDDERDGPQARHGWCSLGGMTAADRTRWLIQLFGERAAGRMAA